MAALWVTYAWADNRDNDVDFVVQELSAAGLTVKLDRWNIVAGRRLWDQFDNFIATQKSAMRGLFMLPEIVWVAGHAKRSLHTHWIEPSPPGGNPFQSLPCFPQAWTRHSFLPAYELACMSVCEMSIGKNA